MEFAKGGWNEKPDNRLRTTVLGNGFQTVDKIHLKYTVDCDYVRLPLTIFDSKEITFF